MRWIILAVIFGLWLGQIGMIRYEQQARAGDELVVHVNAVNNGGHFLENVKVRLYIPELGIIRSISGFELDREEKAGRYISMEIPPGTGAGDYLMIVQASNRDDVNFRAREYRYFTVI
ncbi:MAG: hypothetical protein V1837_05715 [Candidatus Woesearchaeota archaeon]